MSYRKALLLQDSSVNFLKFIVSCVLLAITLAVPARALLAAEPPNSDIERQVESTIRQHFETRVPESRVNVTVNPINRTLSLTPCRSTLQIELPFSGGERVTAKVSCATPRPWSIFVTARVQQFIAVVTARRPITRDSRISGDALALSEQNITRLSGGYYTRLQDVVGKTARVSINNGEIITARVLEPSLAVRRGDRVTLEVRKGALLIRTDAIALEDGRLNEQIDVQNSRSGRQVRGTITAPGVVTLY
ncbi:flagellar basal body P-ring formation protein FlgA [Marinobacterium sp. D7]|uniref:flagellar basal body P-ring formation chaperone FlgA n=1 Tax=Marinobacterium ramblicola TaxID=2849041 RepID=UPI001C2D4E7D|nr:flagellar basal body P-ring formation chaperone FlgA [Marinobacterium ramblicola]MBV1788850.1 flagellar basal body P-ring formation protein FlgA [Marinobacterium ramblicola]